MKRWVRHQWDRTTAILIACGGLVALVLGLAGVNRVRLATQQIPYVASGGLLGLFLLGVAATLWLSADLRDEWRKLDDIHRQMQSDDERGAAAQAGGRSDRSPDATEPGGRRPPPPGGPGRGTRR